MARSHHGRLLLFLCLTAASYDTQPPQIESVVIDDGATVTANPLIHLDLAGSDDTGIAHMCISSTPYCVGWMAYTNETEWLLDSSSQGDHPIYTSLRDNYGNTSAPALSSIYLDPVPPSGGAATTASPASGALTVSWSGVEDSGSGVASYIIDYDSASTPGLFCPSGTISVGADTNSYTVTDLTDGDAYTFRICAVDLAGNLSSGITVSGTPRQESTAPTGDVSINSDAIYATSRIVTLSLTASDDTGVTEMCIGSSASCSAWVPYSTSRRWTLRGSGPQSVYVRFRDASGNLSSYVADTITVDPTAPTQGSLNVSTSDQAATLSWSGFSDSGSGVRRYQLRQHTGSVPTNCSAGTLVYEGSASTVTLTGLDNGTQYGWRLCAQDGAGNQASGVVASATPRSEADAPTATSIQINSGATWTNSQDVTLTLAATDASDVTDMCVSATSTCTAWAPYTTTMAWALGAGPTHTLSAWFRDNNGNTSDAVSATIRLDQAAPEDGTLTGSFNGSAVVLSWSGFTDAHSGVQRYDVMEATTDAPADCTSGTRVYSGTATSTTQTIPTRGGRKGYRVCAVDTAGNVSAGVTTTVAISPDFTAPTGSVSLAAGAAWSRTATVAVTLSASDGGTGVATMCLSESASSCTAWTSYTEETTWTFDETDGERALYAWFRDGVGHTSSAASDRLSLDRTPPTDGALSVDERTLSWSGFSDETSGISRYLVAYNLDGSLPDRCDSADVSQETTDLSLALTGLAELYYQLRVCAQDGAGNLSAGAVAELVLCPTVQSYRDADGDGFGDPSQAELSCAIAAGYVTDASDCDDTLPHSFPGADEWCDGIDNDCDGETDETDAVDVALWYGDGDGDGDGERTVTASGCVPPAGYVATATDCDDTNPAISSLALEVCNSVDDNCDGVVDEASADGAPHWFFDADGDGQGDPSQEEPGCVAPSGYINDGRDCDDTNPAIYQGAPETCDDIDQDCDGSTNDADASDALVWYLDADADGAGDPATETYGCVVPAGAVTTLIEDCDDARDDVYPGATEICQDGVDNNCDGVGCGIDGEHILTSAPAMLLGEQNYAQAGYHVDGGADFDGDGIDDLLIGSRDYDGVDHRGAALVNIGAFYVVPGPVYGTNSLGDIGHRWIGTTYQGYLGGAVANTGDVDGDGYADVLAGGFGDDTGGESAGAAWLLLGPITEGGTISDADAMFIGEDAGDLAGTWVAAGGDLDGDGNDEMLVSGPQAVLGGYTSIIYGVSMPEVESLSLVDADLKVTGDMAYRFGPTSATGVGDLDGDGADDLLIGAPSNTISGITQCGAAFLFSGPVSGTVSLSTADAIMVGTRSASYTGYTLAPAGDTNQDGFPDVLISSYYTSTIYLVQGPITGSFSLSMANAILSTGTSSDGAGFAMDGGGDVNVDGYSDVLIGARYRDDGGDADVGAAYLVYGPMSGNISLSDSDSIFTGVNAYDQVGRGLSFAGDPDQDGATDLLLGAYTEDTGGTNAGTIYVFYAAGY